MRRPVCGGGWWQVWVPTVLWLGRSSHCLLRGAPKAHQRSPWPAQEGCDKAGDLAKVAAYVVGYICPGARHWAIFFPFLSFRLLFLSFLSTVSAQHISWACMRGSAERRFAPFPAHCVFLTSATTPFSAFVMSFKEHALSSASSSTTAFGPLTPPANGEKAVAGARPDPEKGPAKFFDNDESECPDGGLKAWLCVFGVRYFPGMDNMN